MSEEIAQLWALLEKATPEPWELVPAKDDEPPGCVELFTIPCGDYYCATDAHMELVVALRNLAPALLARLAALEKAGGELVAKLDECKQYIDGAFVFLTIHGGCQYDGPQYGVALDEFRAALAEAADA